MNRQMVCMKHSDEIQNKMFKYPKNILVEFIESEKLKEDANMEKVFGNLGFGLEFTVI